MLCSLLTVSVLILATFGSSFPVLATPQAVQLAPGAAADAYGLDVDLTLSPVNVRVDEGPSARATQEFPPQEGESDEANLLGAGPIPAGGEVVSGISALSSTADADSPPVATAASQASDIRLLSQGGIPLITAAMVRARATADCASNPSGGGTEVLDLRVAGVADPVTNPAPNTELAPALFNPLGIKVVLNEQHPAADGRGIVVNGIHIYNFAPSTVPAIFRGDIVVTHAMATVNCPNGLGTTGAQNPIEIVKSSDRDSVLPGGLVTYTTSIRNRSQSPCPVNRVIEHMPRGFEFQETSGALGTAVVTAIRPGGGTDVILRPNAVSIPAGGSVDQTFVLRVGQDTPIGVYFNNVEIFCANLGNWVKGLDAPVEVVTVIPPKDPPPPTVPDEPEEDLAVTGDSASGWVVVGMLLLAAGVRIRRTVSRPSIQ